LEQVFYSRPTSILAPLFTNGPKLSLFREHAAVLPQLCAITREVETARSNRRSGETILYQSASLWPPCGQCRKAVDLKSNPAGHDAGMERRIERHISLALLVIEIKRVGCRGGIESFSRKI
jgi:hypothetical protein